MNTVSTPTADELGEREHGSMPGDDERGAYLIERRHERWALTELEVVSALDALSSGRQVDRRHEDEVLSEALTGEEKMEIWVCLGAFLRSR